jgi:hypothetical protein
MGHTARHDRRRYLLRGSCFFTVALLWPHSSFHRYVRSRRYREDWAAPLNILRERMGTIWRVTRVR